MKRVATSLLILVACGEAAPPARAPSGKTTGSAEAKPAPKSGIDGVGEDSGVCMRTTRWSSAEDWMRAFRPPKSEAPSEGAEVPKVTLERIEVAAGQGLPELRAYEQTARYPLAERTLRRRFLMHEDDGAITGCLLGEGAEKRPKLRFARLAAGVFELTDREEEKAAVDDRTAMVLMTLGGTSSQIRHICSVQDGMLGCVTLETNSRVKVQADRTALIYRGSFSQAILGTRYEGSLRIGIGRGASYLIRTTFPFEALGFAARPTAAIEKLPKPDPPPQPQALASEVGTFHDHGICISGASEQTAELWATLFRGRARHFVEERVHPPEPEADEDEDADAMPVAPDPNTPIVSMLGASFGDAGTFILRREAGRVSGCYLGDVAYSNPVDGSYATFRKGGFRFLARASSRNALASLAGSGSEVEQVLVACQMTGSGASAKLGCARAPTRWTEARLGGLTTGQMKTTKTERTASVHVSNRTLSWDGTRELTLAITPGAVSAVVMSMSGSPSKKQLAGKSRLSSRIYQDAK